MTEEQSIEEITVIHVDNMPENARKEVEEKVSSKPEGFNFKGFAEVKIISASPIRVASFEPIEGTDIDWIRSKNAGSEVDISDIF